MIKDTLFSHGASNTRLGEEICSTIGLSALSLLMEIAKD
jgi:hypothetical protein